MAAETPPGGDGLRVSTDAVEDLAAQFKSIADDLRAELERLAGAAEQVLDASWRGSAARAFTSEWDEFHDNARKVVDDADVIADLVALSMRQYVDSDEAGAAALRTAWTRI